MKLSCGTIQDMLPLVAEDLASEDTVKLVNEHIKNCKECKQEYEEMKEREAKFIDKERIEAIPLNNIKRKLKNKNIYIGILTALIVSLILLIGVDKATKPIPISFNKAIESTKNEDGKLFIKFTPEVSNYNIVSYGDNYDIMAWKTNISKIFESKEPKNTVINVDEEKNVSIHYIEQNGELDKQIYGRYYHGGRITLPRLAMNYYVCFMGIIFLILCIMSIIFRRKARIMKVISTIMIFSISYIVANIIISGIRGSTHHIIRDLWFIVVATILIFSIIISLKYKDSFINNK